MGDLDGARIIITTGQSGNPFDRHYGDMIPAWLNGTQVPLPFTSSAAEKATVSTLVLTLRPPPDLAAPVRRRQMDRASRSPERRRRGGPAHEPVRDVAAIDADRLDGAAGPPNRAGVQSRGKVAALCRRTHVRYG